MSKLNAIVLTVADLKPSSLHKKLKDISLTDFFWLENLSDKTLLGQEASYIVFLKDGKFKSFKERQPIANSTTNGMRYWDAHVGAKLSLKRGRFIQEYQSYGMANTLYDTVIGTHENGWTIDADVHEDYYTWVNYFEAFHKKHGKVWGDFEHAVHASSRKAMEEFLKHFQPHEWDYQDI